MIVVVLLGSCADLIQNKFCFLVRVTFLVKQAVLRSKCLINFVNNLLYL